MKKHKNFILGFVVGTVVGPMILRKVYPAGSAKLPK